MTPATLAHLRRAAAQPDAYVVTVAAGDLRELVEAYRKDETMDHPKYRSVEVQLSGEDGNAFFIISRISTALRRAGVSNDEIAEFRAEAMAGDYNHVLTTSMRWVSVN